jgi:hydrogenase-4 transcriptional activator
LASLQIRPKPSPARLMNYPWPGNVRELENVVERALILSTGGVLTFDDPIREPSEGNVFREHREEDQPLRLDEAMARHIRRVLDLTRGKIHGSGGAAETLGINPSTLRNRMNRLGIPYGKTSRQSKSPGDTHAVSRRHPHGTGGGR